MTFVFTKKTAFYLILAVFFLFFDRFFKTMAISGFFAEPINLISSWFSLNFTANPNIAFSLPFSGWGLNFLVMLIIVVLVVYSLLLAKKSRLSEACALTFVIFGAISNLADRLKFGFVIDYLDLKYFTVFNLADIMIVGGIFLFIFYNFKNKKGEKNEKREKEEGCPSQGY